MPGGPAPPTLALVGDMATWHQPADAVLAMDIDSLARTVSEEVQRWGRAARGLILVSGSALSGFWLLLDSGRSLMTALSKAKDSR